MVFQKFTRLITTTIKFIYLYKYKKMQHCIFFIEKYIFLGEIYEVYF